MVSRANLNGRPGMGGVLKKVMNPVQRQARSMRDKLAPPAETGAGGGVLSRIKQQAQAQQAALTKGGGGMSGMVGRALAAGKEQQAAQQGGGIRQALARGAKAKSAMQPAVAGQKRGPRRQPTVRDQVRNTRDAIAGTRAQAESMRSGLENMGATQEEVAAPGARGMVERAAAGAARGRGILSAEEQATRARGALEETGEIGGTVTEAPVTGPSLNEARRMRSRSGRIRR